MQKLQNSHATVLKIDSNTGVSCEYCDIFKNTCFEEHLQAAVSAKQASKKLLSLSKVARPVIFSDAQWKILIVYASFITMHLSGWVRQQNNRMKPVNEFSLKLVYIKTFLEPVPPIFICLGVQPGIFQGRRGFLE